MKSPCLSILSLNCQGYEALFDGGGGCYFNPFLLRRMSFSMSDVDKRV